MSTSRYFIGIIPPPPLLEKAEEIKRELNSQFGLKGALRSPAHITLHRPFEWPDRHRAELMNKLTELMFADQFDIHLQGFGAFEPRVLFVNVLPSPGLNDLHAALAAFMKRLGVLNEAHDLRAFHPHITVAFRDLRKKNFETVKSFLFPQPFSGSFRYEGFSLLKLSDRWSEEKFYSR